MGEVLECPKKNSCPKQLNGEKKDLQIGSDQNLRRRNQDEVDKFKVAF